MAGGHLAPGPGQHVAEVAPVGARVDRAGLDSREVEEIVHHASKALGLGIDCFEEGVAILDRERLVAQAAGGCGDRRERRSQVVGDRVEERRLGDVGTARGLGFRGVTGHALALTRHVDQPPERIGEAFEALPVPARVGPAIEPSRTARRSRTAISADS